MHLSKKYQVLPCSWSHNFKQVGRGGEGRDTPGEEGRDIKGFFSQEAPGKPGKDVKQVTEIIPFESEMPVVVWEMD